MSHVYAKRRRPTRSIVMMSLVAFAVGLTLDHAEAQVTIMDIQGTGHISAYRGQTVTTSGVVTAVGFDGFYVQDPFGDGDTHTSDGMFVFRGNLCRGCPAVGDYVTLTDRVDEFVPGGCDTGNLSTTNMVFPTVQNAGPTHPIPAPVVIGRGGRIPPNVETLSDNELPVNNQPPNPFGCVASTAPPNPDPNYNPASDGLDFYESLEGMLVTIDSPVAVSPTRSFGDFSSELFVVANDGQDVAPRDVRTRRGGINLAADADGYGDTNPERVQIQFDASVIRRGTYYPGFAPNINVGDRLRDVTGVVGYSFGNYEVNATELVEVSRRSRIAPETTLLVTRDSGAVDQNDGGGPITVASYNVLNLSPDAADDVQRETLADQIVNNLGTPDVIALQEIQDNSGQTDDSVTDADHTLQSLVDAIEAARGPTYRFFDVDPPNNSWGGVPGGNIRNAFLYNPARVDLVSFVSLSPGELAAAGAKAAAFAGTRAPLVGVFRFRGREFTVVNNHLTSRFGSTPIFGGPQPFVQAGEAERQAQMDALNDYVRFLLGDDDRSGKKTPVLVVGDLNTFEFTNDLTDILPGSPAVLRNLIEAVHDDNVYTFIFDGNSQVLDHVLVTHAVKGPQLDIVHINTDFPRTDRANGLGAGVGSDHEPLVVRFHLGANQQ